MADRPARFLAGMGGVTGRGLDSRYLPAIRMVRRLPARSAGRDFVVGDLHGCFDDLLRLLGQVNFDARRDRLLAVGDLGDRGPRSMDCLRLLDAPWFHTVMGNHEQMLLNHFGPWISAGDNPESAGPAAELLFANGGDWVLAECERNGRPGPELGRLLRRIARLPQVMVVGEGRSRFHLVHAALVRPPTGGDLGMGVLTDADLDALPEMGGPGDDRPEWRWSRALFVGDVPKLPQWAQGLSPTFCGHTIGDTVRRSASHICLDTGAFLGDGNRGASRYGLTVAELPAGRYTCWRGGEFSTCLW